MEIGLTLKSKKIIKESDNLAMKVILIKDVEDFDSKMKSLASKDYFLTTKGIKELKDFKIPEEDKKLIFSDSLKYMVIYIGMYKNNPNKLAWDFILKEGQQTSGTSLSHIVKQFPFSRIEVI